MPLIELVLAGALALLVHLGLMVLFAASLGIPVRIVSYGIGPTLFSRGRLQVRAIPLSAYVKFKDSREEVLAPDDCADAFNHQPVWKQVLLPLAGAISLALISGLILGSEGWASFGRGFAQIFEGAVSPLAMAQTYLQAYVVFSGERTFPFVFALVASKLAAFNLLPFGTFNGGQALMNLLRWGKPVLSWEEPVTRWGVFVTLLILAGWALAIGFFLLQHAN